MLAKFRLCHISRSHDILFDCCEVNSLVENQMLINVMPHPHCQSETQIKYQ
jgi:hypothetical protein